MNATNPTDPEVFLSKYRNLSAILADYNFTLYRDPQYTPAETQERQDVVGQFRRYLQDRGRDRTEDAIWHDVTVWMSVKRLRGLGRTFLEARSLFLSTDFRLQRFDWSEVRAKNEIGCVVLPNQLL
jgi:hypothetical protein